MKLLIGDKNMSSTKGNSFIKLGGIFPLGLIYFIILSPIGIIIRIFGVDFLKQKINKKRKSYWEPKF